MRLLIALVCGAFVQVCGRQWRSYAGREWCSYAGTTNADAGPDAGPDVLAAA